MIQFISTFCVWIILLKTLNFITYSIYMYASDINVSCSNEPVSKRKHKIIDHWCCASQRHDTPCTKILEAVGHQ